ncbi:hypothetical protein E2562_005303 [Oryza meyeriana var. granulata]|uniref:DUF834 domain-containing protein n=1 Tax=Oryza meyeriana var. granulata TaxID=110450 RepID=A0A6G1EFZ9_9ORYZ|nr:hypothetical protein E2562_005303 [Oryza meyeriana var. granulata]
MHTAVAEGEDGRMAASSTSWSHHRHHRSAWRLRRRQREHRTTEVRAAVAEAEDRGAEIDAAAAVVSSTSWTHLHQSAWRTRRRGSAPHQPEAIEDRGRAGEAMDGEVEAAAALGEVEAVAAN